MNPKLVEEVARAIDGGPFLRADRRAADPEFKANYKTDKVRIKQAKDHAQAAIRVCMARAAEIAEEAEDECGYAPGGGYMAAERIKREGGVT